MRHVRPMPGVAEAKEGVQNPLDPPITVGARRCW